MKETFIYIIIFSILIFLSFIKIRFKNNETNLKNIYNSKESNCTYRKLSSNQENKKLNNIINIYNPNEKVYYISSIKNNNGDLFILTNIHGIYTERIVFAIKANGEIFFENHDNYCKIIMSDVSLNNVYPTLTFINIKNIPYLVSFSQDGPIELYDFSNDKIYSSFNLNTIKTNSVVRKNTFFSLNFYNNNNYVLNGFINKKSPYTLLIQKIDFQSKELSKSNVILTNETSSDKGYRNSSVTCFENNNIVECLYTNIDKLYTISLYNILNLDFLYNKTIENNAITADFLFSKCIHFKNNIGAFLYFITDDNCPKLVFKELIFPSKDNPDFQISDYITSTIIINKDNKFSIGNNYIYNEIIKIDENNIFYISTKNEGEKLMIILIKILNGDKNLLICYNEIKLKEIYNFKIFTDITVFNFNDFLGVGMIHYDYNKHINKTFSSLFIIGNVSINDINIPEYIDILSEDVIYYFNLEDIIFDIDNNIYGYIPKGIKIVSEINETILGFNIYSKNNQKKIESNEIILINDSISFKKIIPQGIKLGKYSFEIIPIISEPNFVEFSSIFDDIEYYPSNNIDLNLYYNPKFFSGKKANFSFFVKKCYQTCKKCSYFGNEINHQCEECLSEYPYSYKLNGEISGINCFKNKPEIFEENNTNSSNINSIVNDDNYFKTETEEITEFKNIKEKVECSEDFPYKIIEEDTCVQNCSAENFFMKICELDYNSIKAKEDIINNIINDIKNGSLNSLLINVTNEYKIDLLVDNNKDIYLITSSFNQKYKDYNISTVNLGLCENILKEQYKINDNDSLIIFIFENYIDGFSIPIIEYEIFDPNTKEELNLDFCRNVKINISIPVSIDEENLIKYNSSSYYYNNICFPSQSENSTDITLYDRKNEYNENNMSLCEANCELADYNITTKRVTCNCQIKSTFKQVSQIYFDLDKLLDKFSDFKKHSNIGVLKCYEVVFKKEGLIHNIGSYILLFIIFLNIIFSIIFCIRDYKLLYIKIKEIVKIKKQYKNKSENKEKRMISELYRNRNNKKKIKKKEEKEKGKGKFKSCNDLIKVEKNKVKINKIKINNLYIHPAPKKVNNINNTNYEQSNKSIAFLKSKNKNIQNFSKIIKTNVDIYNKNKIFKKKYNKEILKLNDNELNYLPFKKALDYDKRTYCQYYFSLLKTNCLFLFSFYPNNDYNSKIIKISLFFNSFSLYFIVNALFFTDSTMHNIYEDQGDFDIIYQIPQIIYSSVISGIINFLLKALALSQKLILKIKKENSFKELIMKFNKTVKCLNIRFIIFYILCFLLLSIFWYYISCFCAVYKNTQIYLIEDTLLSFFLTLLYPFGLGIFTSLLRIYSLKSKKNELIYKISSILQLI